MRPAPPLSALLEVSDERRPSILVVMHDRLAHAGIIGETVIDAGGRCTTLMPHESCGSARPDRSLALPAEHTGFDGLIVLGGPMHAGDDAGFPHFPPLLELILGFHGAGKPVLGICLGAQLIARAFGAAVFPQGFLEFGFHPVTQTPAGRTDPLLQGLPVTLPLMEWHEDNFHLPDGAALLATGDACRNQIFRIGYSTYAFQCHIEVNADIARSWVRLRAAESGAADPAFFARFEDDLDSHLGNAMAFCRSVTRRWTALAAGSDRTTARRAT